MTKKAKPLLPGEEKLKDPKQEFFCQLYAGMSTRDFFGNGTNSYLYAYKYQDEIDKLEVEEIGLVGEGTAKRTREIDARIKQLKSSAKTSGNRLLRVVHISRRVNFLLDSILSDEMMDREMAFVIGQRFDLMSKVNAYDKVTKIKNRISDKLSGELVVRWEDDDDEDDEPEQKKTSNKKPQIKANIKIQKPQEPPLPTRREVDTEVEWEEDED